MRAELVELRGRIFSELVGPDDPSLEDSVALFQDALAASGDPRRAWTLTLTGMLSDVRAVYFCGKGRRDERNVHELPSGHVAF